MRFSAAAPVTWPTHSAWATWWRHGVAELSTLRVLDDGSVVPPEGRTHDEDPVITLTSGEHLRPGALYVATFPETEKLTAALGIGGTPNRRLAHARVRNLLHPGSLTIDLDSLDEPSSLTLHSDVEHLGGDAALRPDSDSAAEVEIRLDWLRLHFRAFVRSTGAAEELVVEGTLSGRGRWRPVLGPLLATLGPLVSRGAREILHKAARGLTELAEDPAAGPLDGADRRRRDVGRAAQLMSHRAETVAGVMAQRSWWSRRRPAAWLTVLDTLPSPTWPPHQVLESWSRTERQLLREYVQSHRRELPTWVGQELVRREEAVAAAVQESIAAQPDAAGPATHHGESVPVPDVPSIDEQLDLSWLATPRSTLRRIRGRDDPTVPT